MHQRQRAAQANPQGAPATVTEEHRERPGDGNQGTLSSDGRSQSLTRRPRPVPHRFEPSLERLFRGHVHRVTPRHDREATTHRDGRLVIAPGGGLPPTDASGQCRITWVAQGSRERLAALGPALMRSESRPCCIQSSLSRPGTVKPGQAQVAERPAEGSPFFPCRSSLVGQEHASPVIRLHETRADQLPSPG